jgi:hypothetical protein
MTNATSPADHIEGIFSNQIIATDKIIQEFQQKNLVLFQAQMQSGKTGCASLVAFKMIHEKMVDSCHLFCGMSDTALKQQWKNDIRTHGTNYLKSLPEKNTELANKFKKLSQNVYFNRDLRHITSIDAIQNSIILVDEIHYGATAQSALHTVFHKLGLQTILEGNECPELLLNNIYILSITATRANEDSIYHTSPEAQKNWGRVYMEPGIGYKGVVDYYDEGLISNNFKLQSTNRDKIISLLDKYKLLQKYFIIRAVTEQKIYIIELLKELNIKFIFHNRHTSSYKPFFNVEPSEFTVVLIQGKFRLGNQLNKQYICGVFESSNKMNNDTLLQALPGRVCGYNVPDNIDIYVPYTYKKCIEEYKEVSSHTPTKCLTNTKFINNTNPNLKKNCMHNTNISEAYSIKTRKTIDTKLLNNILKSQNKLKSFLEQKKTMTNEELDEYSKNTIDKYLSKLTQTRRFGVYGILDKIPGGATGYYIGGNILEKSMEDINLYKTGDSDKCEKYIQNNPMWLGFPTK